MPQQESRQGQLQPSISDPLASLKEYGVTHASNGSAMHDTETILIFKSVTLCEDKRAIPCLPCAPSEHQARILLGRALQQ
jgi:hypothetical protein